MIELPNKQISRTLPEQVGFNAEKIAEIIKFLNESGLKDLVINLESDSGTLSTEQYAIAELSPSYMVYDGGVFYKVLEDSDYIDYFLLLERVDTSNSDLDVSHFRIRIERDSRNYALEAVNIFTSYNKSQVDSIVSTLNAALNAKANLSGAAFTGAITAPNITETMTGYAFNKGSNNTNFELNHIYAGVVKTGNKITFVLFLGVKTLNALNMGDFKDLGSFTIPASIGSKLYPYTQGGYTTALSCSKVYGVSASYSGIDFIALVRKNNDELITIGVTPASLTTADTTYLLRLEFTFLLSDNLAS